MSLRLAVFDIVGTTVQAGDEVPSAFRDAFRGVGVELSDADVAAIRGRSKRDAIADLLQRHLAGRPDQAALLEPVYTRFREALRTAYRSSVRPVPGAEEVLGALLRSGVAVTLATGLDGETTRLLLEGLGWDALGLSAVVTGDDVARGRPAPDLIQAAMRRTGIDAAGSVLAVGDTTADLEAAAAAGVGWAVGVLSGAHPRTRLEALPHAAILDSVRDLPDWLEAAGLGSFSVR